MFSASRPERSNLLESSIQYTSLDSSVSLASGSPGLTDPLAQSKGNLHASSSTAGFYVTASPTVTIAASDALAAETKTGVTPDPGLFTISRTGSTATALTVNYTTRGTATKGSDYNSLSGSITIAVGESSVNLALDVIDDTTIEDAETVSVSLAANTAYALGTNKIATVKIADDDLPVVTIAASDALAAETKTGVTPDPGLFTITRTGSTATALTVKYTTGDTATNGSDYNTLSGSITIPVGASSVNLALNVIDDTTVEGAETASITLSAPTTAYTLGTTKTASVKIADNDTAAVTHPYIAAASSSGNTSIDSLWNPYFAYWNTGSNGGKITYSFLSSAASGSYYGSEIVSEVSEAIKNNVRSIMSSLESLINVNFVEVADTATSYGVLRYMFSDGPGYAYGYYPYSNTDHRSGDIHLSANYESDSVNGFNGSLGSHGYTSLIHETFHGLGLKHPGNYNGGGTGESPFLSPEQDNNTNTVMTYNFSGSSPITPMAYDIRALQYIYGARSYNSANTTYSFSNVQGYTVGGVFKGSTTTPIKQSLWDSGGIDTLDFSGVSPSTSYYFDMNQGGSLTTQAAYNSVTYNDLAGGGTYTTSYYGTTLAYNTVIENLINSRGNDYIIANSAANRFAGYTSGTSTGNDILLSTSSSDVLDLSGYSLSNLTPTITGSDLNIGLESYGSVAIKNYYGSSSSMKILVAGNYYTYSASAGWQATQAPAMSLPVSNKATAGLTSTTASPYNSRLPLTPVECNCSLCSGNGQLMHTLSDSSLSKAIGIDGTQPASNTAQQTHQAKEAKFSYPEYRDRSTPFYTVVSDTGITASNRSSGEAEPLNDRSQAFEYGLRTAPIGNEIIKTTWFGAGAGSENAYNSAIVSNYSSFNQPGTNLSINLQALGTSVAGNYNSSNLAFAGDIATDEFLRRSATV